MINNVKGERIVSRAWEWGKAVGLEVPHRVFGWNTVSSVACLDAKSLGAPAVVSGRP